MRSSRSANGRSAKALFLRNDLVVLSFLKVKNIALIDELSLEFGDGLNLLTGETGSGKSIIVDSLGALTGKRVSSHLIKEGADSASIEGVFSIEPSADVTDFLNDAGIDLASNELIVRRELSLSGKNRIFVNDQIVTSSLLKQIGSHLVDIHGQGEQATLYDTETHIAMLDEFAANEKLIAQVAAAFESYANVRSQLGSLKKDESEKLQLSDILRFQINEIGAADLQVNEESELEDEKRRLTNVEKLTSLSGDAFTSLYDQDQSTATTLERAQRKIAELAEFDSRFAEYDEGIKSARAVIEDLAFALRDFSATLEFSPERLNEIENRLADITRLKRKYGDSIEAILEHLSENKERLNNIETAEFREEELKRELDAKLAEYKVAAGKLHDARVKAAKLFSVAVEKDLKEVALEKAKFEVRIDPDDDLITPNGSDRVEFYFSANPGEPPRPLAKVASGGEASRLMLILKTAARSNDAGKTAVFDEIDIGIGGRVAEAVGRKLKNFAANQQVLCVTHQPQIASLADRHFVVEKSLSTSSTSVSVRELGAAERVEEVARMLAGEQITEAARENARSMLAGK